MPSNKVQSMTNQPEVKGHKLDEELANGPLENRSCTDVLCCLLFIAFVGGMIGVAGYALSKGNPQLIGRGYDADGNLCGFDSVVKNYPYLYWPRPISTGSYLTKTVCVAACPTGPTQTSVVCKTNTAYSTCVDGTTGLTTDSAKYQDMISPFSPSTRFYTYTTTKFANRFCLPQLSSMSAASSSVMNSEVLEQWVSDIRQTWPVILGSIGAAFLIGLIYMILLRYCSGVLTWLAIIAFIAGTAVLGYRFYVNSNKTSDDTASVAGSSSSTTTTQKTITTEKIIAYFCWGVSGATFIAVLCLFNRIRLAIAILKAAADYVKETPSVFLVPPVTIVFLLGLYAYWGITAVYLVSSGDATQMKNTPFGTFEFSKTLQRLLIYHLFGLLWFNAFVIAANQFIFASSASMWYFSQGTGQFAGKTIRTSIYRLIRYHIGSIAFGSLILAIIQFVQIVLTYIQKQAEKMAGKEGKLIKYTLMCMQCYLDCFKRFIEFLNKNAYIQIALTGKSFCKSAYAAMKLISTNPIRFSIVGGIAGVFVMFGKVFIAALSALAGFLVITNWTEYSEGLYSPFIPTICMFIFAYVIGAVFMTIYGLAADAILVCFIVDEQLQKEKNAPPLHCPESLKEFLDKNKK